MFLQFHTLYLFNMMCYMYAVQVYTLDDNQACGVWAFYVHYLEP